MSEVIAITYISDDGSEMFISADQIINEALELYATTGHKDEQFAEMLPTMKRVFARQILRGRTK